jgi:hypothetical protein
MQKFLGRMIIPTSGDRRATRICHEARNNALWQYVYLRFASNPSVPQNRHRFNLDASETFLPNLIYYCYVTPVEQLGSRRFAPLLMYFSIGPIVDLSWPLGALYGEAYHQLARAAVCEIPLKLMKEPDFDVLHALVSHILNCLATL